MRSLSPQEIKQVSGGLEDFVPFNTGSDAPYDFTLLDAAGLNNTGAFSAIDAGDYAAVVAAFDSMPTLPPTEGVESWNFITPTGAVIHFGMEVIEHIYDTYIKP